MNIALLRCWAIALPLFFSALAARGAPGAHGPNGEHLDRPAAAATAGSVPRFETRSEAFEMVGRLTGGELQIFVNRYETNEPIEGALVELEFGSLKATAPFHGDQGDYAVADGPFLAALQVPGDHALVITLTTGQEADLLDAALHVPSSEAHEREHDHPHWESWLKRGAAATLLLVLGIAIGGWLQRRRARGTTLEAVR